MDHPLTPDFYSELLQNPFVNRRNLGVDEPEMVIMELGYFTRQGGRSVVGPTCRADRTYQHGLSARGAFIKYECSTTSSTVPIKSWTARQTPTAPFRG